MHLTSLEQMEMPGVTAGEKRKPENEEEEEEEEERSEGSADGGGGVGKSREALVEDDSPNRLLYNVEDNPPWYSCIFLGLQHFLMMVESTVSIPYLLTPLMCMADHDPARGAIASTIIFVSGIVTLLQTTFGVRLPIVQGGTHGLLSPILAILTLMPCPPESQLVDLTTDERRDLWQTRMQQVQGAICVAAVFQVVVGFTGAIGGLLRWITPMVIVPTVSLIGFSLYPVAADKAASNWGISALTIILLIVFSQYMGNIAVPFLSWTRGRGFTRQPLYVFKLFPVLLAVCVAWLVCYGLTATETLSPGDPARTDLRLSIIHQAPWFRVPYPCQWGMPVVSVAGVMGVLAGVIASIVESIGDYYACAKLAGAPPPPKHAINRGIWVEGVGTMMAGLWGTGSGTTSYSQNVGAIGVTKVGSLRVVQYSAAIMLLCGLMAKVGAIFITIPEPIIGGIFCVVFGMITSVGLSSLQYIDLNSSRNLFVIGFSIFFGLALPRWMQKPENANIISTSLPVLDQVLSVLLRTSMFVGGFLGFVLDNTIPGSDEERGMVVWRAQLEHRPEHLKDGAPSSCYNLPVAMDAVKRCTWTRYFPIMPTFSGWGFLKSKLRKGPSQV